MWNHKWKYGAMVFVLMGLTAVAALVASRAPAEAPAEPSPNVPSPSNVPHTICGDGLSGA